MIVTLLVAPIDRSAAAFTTMSNPFHANSWLTPYMRVCLAPPGMAHRVHSVELSFLNGVVRVPDMLGWDWTAIDEWLADMESLQTVLFLFIEKQELLLFAREVVASRMPRLRDSSTFRYVLEQPWNPMPYWMSFRHRAIDDGMLFNLTYLLAVARTKRLVTDLTKGHFIEDYNDLL